MSESRPQHSHIPGGEFIICRNTFFTGKACGNDPIYISREAREISRHLKKCHAQEHKDNNNRVQYEECAIITQDAAKELVGSIGVYIAEEKDRAGIPEYPFDRAPRYPDYMPVRGDAEATCLAASAAIAKNAREKNPPLECREPVTPPPKQQDRA